MKNIFDQLAESTEQENESPPPGADSTDLTESNQLAANELASSTSTEVKATVQELLKYGYIEETERCELFRRAIVYETAVNIILEPLDLVLRIDSHRGVAYLAVAQTALNSDSDGDAWSHPLVRRQRLTLEQSLLIAHLRQAYVMHEQEYGVGQRQAKFAVEDLVPQMVTYLGDSGSDTKNENRVLTLLDQLKTYGIVSEVDKQHEVTIRPLIAHLANPESLTALLQVLKEQIDATDNAIEGVDAP